MGSSVRHARGAFLATAAASLLGLPPIGGAAGDDLTAASTLTETVAAVDVTAAPGDEVVSTLEQVDLVVSGLAEEAHSAAEAEAEAAAELEAAEEAVAELERRVAGDAEASGSDTADTADTAGDDDVVAPTTGVLDGLSGQALAPTTGRTSLASTQRPADRSESVAPTFASLFTARLAADEAAARAEAEAEAADEAAAALAEAHAQGTEFVATVEERVTTNLDWARSVKHRDRDRADAVWAEEQEIATSLEGIAESQAEWDAAVEEVSSDAETGDAAAADEPARPEPDATPAERRAAAEKAEADRIAAEKAEAERIAAEQVEAARAAREAALRAPLPDPAGAVSGRLAAALCADNRRIVVDSSIGANIQALIDHAAADGVGICARSAFRPAAEQIELRRQNCGSSPYAVYHAPPSTCSPPTARPGTSNHEGGLAVDFSCDDGQPMTHASPCFRWLAGHAASYGMFNLPSEPWHWSVTGR